MKVILIDLPFLSVSFNRYCPFCVKWLGKTSLKEIEMPPPLALGYLASAIKHDPVIGKDVDVYIWGSETTSLLTNSSLIRKLMSEEPDVIGFATYLWNVHEVMGLIRHLKKMGVRSKLILGGPEVFGNVNMLLDRSQGADIIVKGEGEITFRELIRYLRVNKNNLNGLKKIHGLVYRDSNGRIVETKNRELMRNLSIIPSPYLTGIIDISNYSSLYLETYRGCNLRCNFCFYHKNYPFIREHSLTRIKNEVQMAIDNGISNIYIIDATFNEQRRIMNVLKIFRDKNKNKELNFFAEIRADLVTNTIAKLFSEANFPFLEIGLQTINKKALRAMNRPFNKILFEKGIRNLKKNGIRVGVDLIIGLPEDDFNSIKETLNYLVKLSVDYVFPYILSVLPGTDFYNNAKKYGLKFMRKPPYFIIENKSLSQDEIKKTFKYVQKFISEHGKCIQPMSYHFNSEKKFINYFQDRMGLGI